MLTRRAEFIFVPGGSVCGGDGVAPIAHEEGGRHRPGGREERGEVLSRAQSWKTFLRIKGNPSRARKADALSRPMSIRAHERPEPLQSLPPRYQRSHARRGGERPSGTDHERFRSRSGEDAEGDGTAPRPHGLQDAGEAPSRRFRPVSCTALPFRSRSLPGEPALRVPAPVSLISTDFPAPMAGRGRRSPRGWSPRTPPKLMGTPLGPVPPTPRATGARCLPPLRLTRKAPGSAHSQGLYEFRETLNRSRAVMSLEGKAPTLGSNAFVAPSANVIGKVTVSRPIETLPTRARSPVGPGAAPHPAGLVGGMLRGDAAGPGPHAPLPPVPLADWEQLVRLVRRGGQGRRGLRQDRQPVQHPGERPHGAGRGVGGGGTLGGPRDRTPPRRPATPGGEPRSRRTTP